MTPDVLSGDHISVCICTYRRNELLERLLRNLAVQDTGGQFRYSVVVVDNDPSEHARDIVETTSALVSLDVTYGVEHERTIPAVRNHALRLARGNYIAIIDDDEFPPPDWLRRMYEGIRTFTTDGALGPVNPHFLSPPPAWLIRSGMCLLPSYPTGTILHWSQTRTGNVLLKRRVFEDHGLSFDTRFRTGGSDQDFFRRAGKFGRRFVFIEEAPVYEVVPPARWTRTYWLKRALVNGFNSREYAARDMNPVRQALATLKSAVATVAYLVALPACVCLGQHRLINCLEKACYHLSRACASFGLETWKKRDF